MSAVAQLVERLTGDRRVAGLRLTAGRVTVLCPLAKTLYPLLNTRSTQENRQLSGHD